MANTVEIYGAEFEEFQGVGGTRIYRNKKPNPAGGHDYYTDENGPLTKVWDTALVAMGTLLISIAEESRRAPEEKSHA